MSFYRLVQFLVAMTTLVLVGLSLTGHLPHRYHWITSLLGLLVVTMWIGPGIVERSRSRSASAGRAR